MNQTEAKDLVLLALEAIRRSRKMAADIGRWAEQHPTDPRGAGEQWLKRISPTHATGFLSLADEFVRLTTAPEGEKGND